MSSDNRRRASHVRVDQATEIRDYLSAKADVEALMSGKDPLANKEEALAMTPEQRSAISDKLKQGVVKPKPKPKDQTPAKKPAAKVSGTKTAPAKKAPAKKAASKAKPNVWLEDAGDGQGAKDAAAKGGTGAALSAPVRQVKSTDPVAVKFTDVVKTYKLYKNDRHRVMGIFASGKRKGLVQAINAVDHLSFEIKRGEAVALIGRNGAGKSTTLKMITGVTHPTSGDIIVNGQVSALLELTAGFDTQLTGRENIVLRGQILGLSDEQIKALQPQVIDFAELGPYIDQPLRTYSSGMRSRLGFAFAVSIDPEILVVDETLSVGDKAFQRKCIKRIREIMSDSNVTVLFVTHTSATAKEFCQRGIVLDQGHCVFDGQISQAIDYYNEHF